MAECYKPITIRPLTSGLDARSMPEAVPYGWMRWAQAVQVTAKDKLCRSPGWRKFGFDVEPVNNRDLHDQLGFERQPVNALFNAVSPFGFSSLFVGTQNRLYAGNGSTSNYAVISDNLGGEPTSTCSARTWQFAQQGDIVVVSNQLDKVMYHVLGQPPEEDGQSLSRITSLESVGVTRAQVLVAWKGFIFAMNVVSDGQRVSDRIHWSDFQKPLSWKPSAASLAGKQDLGFNETILAALPLGDTLQIYTNNGIWVCTAAGEQGFSFAQKYSEPRGSNACLAYPATLISTGEEHLYFGRDGIYSNNPYSYKPERTEWIHRASSIIFDDLNSGSCSLPCGGFDSIKKLAWFSWARAGENCNTQTLRFNIQYPFADYLPKGFSAFVSHQPDTYTSIADWVKAMCICDAAGLAAINEELGVGTEGGFCTGSEPAEPDCPDPLTSIYTLEGKDLGDGETFYEDYEKEADPASLFTALGDTTFDQLCGAEQTSDDCNAALKFLGASLDDSCVKDLSVEFYGIEICTDNNDCGTYETDGYDSVMRFGPFDFRTPDQIKSIKSLLLEAVAAVQETPSKIELRIGISRQAADPNTGECALVWHQDDDKDLACADSVSGAVHAAENTVPDTEPLYWPLLREGRHLYFEFKITGIGGASCFSSLTMEVAPKQGY